MNFTYENQGTNTYLVYPITAEDTVDSMSLGMLTNNKIQGLAPALFMQMNADKFIKYNISAHISVKQFFSGPVNKKRLIGVFKGIVNAMLSAEEYMIDESTIIMDLDYIFADVSTCETVLICLPIQNARETHDLGAFFKSIMFTTQFDQMENCDYVARIINYLNSTPLFSLVDFKELLETIEQTKTAIVVKPPEQPKVEPAEQPKVEPAPKPQPKPEPTPKPVPPVMDGPIPPKDVSTGNSSQKPEKEISLLGLLRNYSKENVELYKAQKEAKKNAGKAPANVPAPVKVQKPTGQNKPAQNHGFAIPGQEGGAGFAIPGQEVPAPQPVATPTPQPAVEPQPVNKPTPQPVVQPAPEPTPAFVPRSGSTNFGDTTVLGGGSNGETTVLKAATAPKQVIAPHLIRIKNNEKISLNKPVFRVGKERSYVDYFIGDNTAVSRSHANIITRDGEYFVVDMNSTNHTFVNGEMISSSVEVKIEHGTKLMFGNEEFVFKVY